MNSVVSKLGHNFLIAAFIPSLAFATISLVIFNPIIPEKAQSLLKDTIAPLDEPALVLLMITVIIGFSLYSLNTYIYKIMEGYFIFNRVPAITRFQQRKALKTYIGIAILEKRIEQLMISNSEDSEIDLLKQQLFYLSSTYQLSYPLSPKLIMPTRFGNVLRAMEAYPRQRYRMDAVLLWPRLIHVMPKEYYGKLDESNNGLAFLINCSILSLGLGIANGGAALYQYLILQLAKANYKELLYFIPIDTSYEGLVKYQQNIYLYLFGIVVMMGLFVLFYRAAIPIAIQYSNLVRSAFDLFRWHLTEALHLEQPGDYDDEKRIWENLSMFIGHGLLNDYMVPFEYKKAANGNQLENVHANEGLGNSAEGEQE